MAELSSNLDELRKQKMRSLDRVFVLEPTEKFTPAEAGTVDKRLYTKGNNLHAKQQPNGLWTLYLDHGTLPQPLKQQFTGFNICEDTIRKYYAKRNISVKEVLD